MLILQKVAKWFFFIGIAVGVVVVWNIIIHPQREIVYSPVNEENTINTPVTSEPPAITTNVIFAKDHTWTATLSAKLLWTLVATGDIIPARSVNEQTVKKNDFVWAWRNIRSYLKEADIAFINLESPLLSDCPVINTGFVFCGDRRHVEGMQQSGVDVVSFANNHMGNYGLKGIEETKNILQEYGIRTTGDTNQPAIMTAKDIRIAFLAYNDVGYEESGIAWANEADIAEDIQKARKNADVIIVGMSWGIEYTSTPSERQRLLAHHVIDAGADLIIGNHPHWIQPFEFYKGKMIMYAHGNTIFDQMWSEETKIGVIGRYTFYKERLIDVEFIPTYIRDYGQPEVLTSNRRQAVLDHLARISVQ